MPSLIVHASLENPEGRWGGIASALDLLVTASVAGGQTVAVLSIGDRERTIPSADGRSVVHLVGIPELRGTVLYQNPDRVRLAEIISERMVDALSSLRSGGDVHLLVHNDELATFAEALSTQRWIRSSVALVHGVARQEHPTRPELHRLQDRLLNSVDGVGVFSRSYLSVVKRYYPELRELRHVSLPLEVLVEEVTNSGTRQVANVSEATLLAAGRAVPQKGFDILLDALHRVRSDTIRHASLIMGHGAADYERACAARAESIGSFVSMTGWVSRADLLRRMAQSAAVVVPSRFEPFGLVAAEAIALGVPVVASGLGGLTELIEEPDLGWLVPADEGIGPAPEDLANALVAAVESPTAVTAGPEFLRQWTVSRTQSDLASLLGVEA